MGFPDAKLNRLNPVPFIRLAAKASCRQLEILHSLAFHRLREPQADELGYHKTDVELSEHRLDPH